MFVFRIVAHDVDIIIRVGFDWLMPLMNYCAEWRNQRRALHQVLNPDAVAQYRDIQFKVTRDLMRNLLDTPHDLALHLRL